MAVAARVVGRAAAAAATSVVSQAAAYSAAYPITAEANAAVRPPGEYVVRARRRLRYSIFRLTFKNEHSAMQDKAFPSLLRTDVRERYHRKSPRPETSWKIPQCYVGKRWAGSFQQMLMPTQVDPFHTPPPTARGSEVKRMGTHKEKQMLASSRGKLASSS